MESYPSLYNAVKSVMPDEIYHLAAQNFVDNLKSSNKIRVLGHVKNRDFPTFYALAHAVVFPSLCEGFGYPALEAMSMSCPVVCSNMTSPPEIAGDAALLFNPYNHADITAKIRMILDDDDLRKDLVIVGHENLKRFDETKSASRLLNSYTQCVKSFQKNNRGARTRMLSFSALFNGADSLVKYEKDLFNQA